MGRLKLAVPGVVLALLVPVYVLQVHGSGEDARPPAPAWSIAPSDFVLRDIGYDVSEPTVGVLGDGTLLVQARTHVLASADGGVTWRGAYSAPGKRTLDPFLHVDQVLDRAFTSQLATACQLFAFGDRAVSWTTSLQCPPVDHQKIGSGPWRNPPASSWGRVVYTCFNRIVDTACATSADGGATWLPPVPVFPGSDPGAEHALAPGGICGGLEGNPVSGPDGTIYLPREHCGRTYLAASDDDGWTWRIHWVAQAETRPIAFGANNPAAAVDDDDTVYVAWTGADWRHYVARSRDHGATWSAAMPVAPGILSTTFPLLAAGAGGRVATAFLGTSDTDRGPDLAPFESRWHLFAAFSADADAAQPTWTVVQLTPDEDPVMIGCVGRHGHACPNDNLLDFNGIATTPEGRVVISYTDGCVGCITQTDSTATEGYVAVQVGGERLR